MVQPADAAKEISRLSREMERLYHELSLKTGLSDSAFLIFYAIGELGDGLPSNADCRRILRKQADHQHLGKAPCAAGLSFACARRGRGMAPGSLHAGRACGDGAEAGACFRAGGKRACQHARDPARPASAGCWGAMCSFTAGMCARRAEGHAPCGAFRAPGLYYIQTRAHQHMPAASPRARRRA